MATATLDQTKDINVDEQYTITSTISAAVEMETELFVYNYASSAYSHVANINDMENYPTTPTEGTAYYRQDTVTQAFDTPAEADAAAVVHSTRVNELVYQYNTEGAGYDGSTTQTVLEGAGID